MISTARRLLLFTVAIALTLVCSRVVASSHESIPAAWVEMGSDGFLARVITENVRCPNLQVDGEALSMQVHAEPTAEFPVKVCQAKIPENASSLTVEGQALPMPNLSPKKIAILGDTGCRIKGKHVQACNDPEQWPFAQVSQAIANYQPDLIIHTGDYLYREAQCPADNPGCAGSPWGYGLDAWIADYLEPAQPLFKTAPLVLVRGNHESCYRAGQGWFHLLDPNEYKVCKTETHPNGYQWDPNADYTDPYSYTLNNLDLIVFDDSLANDDKADPEQVERYRPQVDAVKAMVKDSTQDSQNTWFLVHRPAWGVDKDYDAKADPDARVWLNQTLEAALTREHHPGEPRQWLAQIGSIFSGHIHNFERIHFEKQANLPMQWVIGNGGTALSLPVISTFDGLENHLKSATVEDGSASYFFGFTTFERQDSGDWRVSSRDRQGQVVQEWLN